METQGCLFDQPERAPVVAGSITLSPAGAADFLAHRTITRARQHAHHAMHNNSLAAFVRTAGERQGRSVAVLAWFREHGPATDRECMAGMGYTDPNAVRPRITEMLQTADRHGNPLTPKLREVGTKSETCNGKTLNNRMVEAI